MPSRDVDTLREASYRVHSLALWLDLEADRIEITGMDDEARQALAAAHELLGIDGEEIPCGD